MATPVRIWLSDRHECDELSDLEGVELRYLSWEEWDALEPSDVRGVDALLGWRPDLPAEAFEEVGADLRVVMRPGAGYDNVDVAAATEHGVAVTHAPQGPQNAVVEGTVGLMISCARSLHVHNARIREHGFEDRGDYPAFELGGSTVGILGLGVIGKLLAERLAHFGADLQAHDPYVDEADAAELGVDLVSLEDLLETSDLLTIHVPLTDDTHHMLGAEDFRKMQDTAFVINAARGGIYPEEDLARAIREGWIAGAAVDVFEDEGDVSNSPLLDLDETEALLTPHILGNASREARERVHDIVVETVRALARGEHPPNVINPEAYDEAVPADRLSPGF